MTDQPRYNAVPPQIDLPAMEREILDLWRREDTFARSIERNAGGDSLGAWTFYEGPPTANGRPGTHHVESRSFKDVFPRFKTMQGYQVTRKGGWDCHGLPVELAVEKELGFTGKAEVEKFGIAAFNARCRESVQRHVDLWEGLTERMGFWLDMSDPYRTMDPAYVESVWWALSQIHGKGLLVEDHRVAPYCPRCGTGLSDHELAQGYETVTDPSVYVRFPLTSGEWAGKAALLAWTTTPWTLVSNTATAVNADVTYVMARTQAPDGGSELLIVAEALREKVLGEDSEVVASMQGSELVGLSYSRPFELIDFPEPGPGADGPVHTVLAADFVTTEDGTGVVHEAPAFGAEDFALCRANSLPIVNPITPQGEFEVGIDLVGGVFFKDADALLVEDLDERGLLFRHQEYEHTYPHCWRCHTALLYYAQPSWYIRTTAVKDALLRENERTDWHPDRVKHGRYGDWLENNIDWALSRSRYWGTPLPIWRCEAGHQTCVQSLAHLSELTGADQSGLDPHRPFIDEVTFVCPGGGAAECGQTATRVPEVIDAWFDSGSMPFAQWGYPHVEGSVEKFETAFPAQFICEAIDQTRGWFYTLMAVNTLVFDRSAYESVLCLGHIMAEDGRKMSKHLGNIIEPLPLMDTHGADAVRWFMTASGSPWSARRVGDTTIQETVRKVLLTYWNTVAFQVLYAGTSQWTPGTHDSAEAAPAPDARPVLDRWLLSEAERVTAEVTAAYEAFDTQRVGSLLATFVDDLSNWYVRRSRRRFWDGDVSALTTLHDTLVRVTQLMAPMTPFITERVWQDLVVPAVPAAADSVHLSAWPTADLTLVDGDLARGMHTARRLVELGRAARAEAKVRTRQPLRRALVAGSTYDLLGPELRAEVAAELNLGDLEPLGAAGSDEAALVDVSAKGNFRELGRRFAKQTPVVAQAIADADAAALQTALRAEGSAPLLVDGETVQVTAAEVIISERPREGWSVVNEQGETIALDLELTPALVRAGLAREVVRVVQEARKDAGFEVSDRIALTWSADDPESDLAHAMHEHADEIAEEVLATRVEHAGADALTGTGVVVPDKLGVRLRVALA